MGEFLFVAITGHCCCGSRRRCQTGCHNVNKLLLHVKFVDILTLLGATGGDGAAAGPSALEHRRVPRCGGRGLSLGLEVLGGGEQTLAGRTMSRDGVVVPLGRQRRVGREVKSCGVPDDGGRGGGGDGFTSLGCFGDGVGECTGHITQHFLRARRQNPRRREEGDAATSFAAAALPGAKPPAPPPRCSESQFQRQQQHQKRIKLFRVEEGKEEGGRRGGRTQPSVRPSPRRPQGRRSPPTPCKTSAAAAGGLETKLLLSILCCLPRLSLSLYFASAEAN